MLKGAAGVHILATSREPLRAEGERVLRLPPLGMPPISPGLTAAQAMGYPSVQLFVERASAILDGFVLQDADAPTVAEICTRLDGIALAIELAVGHVAAFDLRSLAALLDDRFRLLTRGRRTALPRHQTMRAVLDWSYETAPELERRVLRRLAVFEGGIQLAAARAVAGDDELDGDAVVASLASLVDRSLVTADISDAGARYRLLDTTRAYALEKLVLSGEQATVARNHADYYVAALIEAEFEWRSRPAAVWLAKHGQEIGNVRAALDWAFSARWGRGARCRSVSLGGPAAVRVVAGGGMPSPGGAGDCGDGHPCRRGPAAGDAAADHPGRGHDVHTWPGAADRRHMGDGAAGRDRVGRRAMSSACGLGAVDGLHVWRRGAPSLGLRRTIPRLR